MMKAIRVEQFGGPEVLVEQQVIAPELLRSTDVLIDVKAAGVNPVDVYIRNGSYPLVQEVPFIPGIDGAGLVKKVGEDVHLFSPGDRVYFSSLMAGSYAEQVVCPACEVGHLPECLSFVQGAALGIPFSAAFRGLFQKAKAVDQDSVLIHGASGGVGCAALQMAKAIGCRVIATAGSDRGRALLKELGADLVLDHSDSRQYQQLKIQHQEQGVDIILEMLANENLSEDLKVLNQGGRLVVIGCRGEVTINPRELMAKELDIRGLFLFLVPAEEKRKIYQAVNNFIVEQGVRPVIGQEYNLAEVAAAQQAIMNTKAKGKIVLIP